MLYLRTLKRFAGLDGLIKYIQGDLAALNALNALIRPINLS